MATVVHPVVENANNQDAGVVGLEEDAVPATRGHLDADPEVVARTHDHRTSQQALHRFAKGLHVLAGLVWPPGPHGVATNRGKIRVRDFSENEALHRLANRASISSSVSN